MNLNYNIGQLVGTIEQNNPGGTSFSIAFTVPAGQIFIGKLSMAGTKNASQTPVGLLLRGATGILTIGNQATSDTAQYVTTCEDIVLIEGSYTFQSAVYSYSGSGIGYVCGNLYRRV